MFLQIYSHPVFKWIEVSFYQNNQSLCYPLFMIKPAEWPLCILVIDCRKKYLRDRNSRGLTFPRSYLKERVCFVQGRRRFIKENH